MVFCSMLVSYRVEEQVVSALVAEFLETLMLLIKMEKVSDRSSIIYSSSQNINQFTIKGR